MVRKIVTIVLVIGMLAGICTLEQVTVLRLTKEALDKTHAIMDAIRAEETEEALSQAKELDTLWDERGEYLETLVNHSSTDDVRFMLSRLTAAIETEDMEWALIYASELEGGIEHVRERQVLTVQNLL